MCVEGGGGQREGGVLKVWVFQNHLVKKSFTKLKFKFTLAEK